MKSVSRDLYNNYWEITYLDIFSFINIRVIQGGQGNSGTKQLLQISFISIEKLHENDQLQENFAVKLHKQNKTCPQYNHCYLHLQFKLISWCFHSWEWHPLTILFSLKIILSFCGDEAVMKPKMGCYYQPIITNNIYNLAII